MRNLITTAKEDARPTDTSVWWSGLVFLVYYSDTVQWIFHIFNSRRQPEVEQVPHVSTEGDTYLHTKIPITRKKQAVPHNSIDITMYLDTKLSVQSPITAYSFCRMLAALYIYIYIYISSYIYIYVTFLSIHKQVPHSIIYTQAGLAHVHISDSALCFQV